MKKLITLALLLTLIFSCKKEDKFAPRAINFDRDVCYVCLMGLTDQRYNVQAINDYGEVRWYDDIGCLAEDIRNKQQWEQWKGKEAHYWIGDASKGNDPSNWIDAEKSYYDYGKHTPMGYGYSAYYIKPTQDSIFTFDQVLKRIDEGQTMRQAFLKEKMMMNEGNPEKMKMLEEKMKTEMQKTGVQDTLN